MAQTWSARETTCERLHDRGGAVRCTQNSAKAGPHNRGEQHLARVQAHGSGMSTRKAIQSVIDEAPIGTPQNRPAGLAVARFQLRRWSFSRNLARPNLKSLRQPRQDNEFMPRPRLADLAINHHGDPGCAVGDGRGASLQVTRTGSGVRGFRNVRTNDDHRSA